MKYDSNKHHRRSIRLKGYDYSQAGAYFITICTHNRDYLFGDVVNRQMVLNEWGEIIKIEWVKTSQLRANVKLDAFVIMPNHIHGIIVLNNMDDCRDTARRVPTTAKPHQTEQFGKPVSGSLPTIVRSYKSAVTKRINDLRQTPGAPVRRRNYYEPIIRNENELSKIREYILNNPCHLSYHISGFVVFQFRAVHAVGD
ncbi:hypothetical protein BMS3Abin05_00718 [bacterium BMS3Abin05]|nr:hypothetical protein BMS3Abin05_00718 [bacterium BMS3Abin05]